MKVNSADINAYLRRTNRELEQAQSRAQGLNGSIESLEAEVEKVELEYEPHRLAIEGLATRKKSLHRQAQVGMLAGLAGLGGAWALSSMAPGLSFAAGALGVAGLGVFGRALVLVNPSAEAEVYAQAHPIEDKLYVAQARLNRAEFDLKETQAVIDREQTIERATQEVRPVSLENTEDGILIDDILLDR